MSEKRFVVGLTFEDDINDLDGDTCFEQFGNFLMHFKPHSVITNQVWDVKSVRLGEQTADPMEEPIGGKDEPKDSTH